MIHNKADGSVLFSNIFAGAISGLMTVIASISYATLVFSGSAAKYLQLGIASALVSAAVIGLFIAWRSSSPVTIAGPDANISAVLALIASGIVSVAVAGGASDGQVFTLLWITLAFCSLMTGVFLFIIGRFKLGAWIRFIPYPVVGGFLAGTGWLLIRGSFKVMCGTSLGLKNLTSLVQLPVMIHWFPGVLFAVVLLLILRRYKHFLIMPVALVSAILISHICLRVAGLSLSGAMNSGWLLEPFPSDLFSRSFTSLSPAGTDLSLLTGNFGNYLALMIIAAIVILLNAASVELTTKKDMELDRELSVTGLANIISAPLGGMTGCMALSRTILNFKAGATSRLAGMISALLCGALLLFAAKALSLFPRPVLGGLLFFLGLSLLVEWVFDGWKKLSRFDFFLVIIIVIIIAVWGFLPGVGIGLVIACMFFAFNYSRTGAVKRVLTGAKYRSNVERSLAQEEILRSRGDSIYIVQLQGFIFFGTAFPLLTRIKERILAPGPQSVEYIILDLSAVTNLDSSSILSFSKLSQFAQAEKVLLLFTGMKKGISDLLAGEGCISRSEILPETGHEMHPEMRPETDRNLQQTCDLKNRVFPDLDHALGWCEDRIIDEAGVRTVEQTQTFTEFFSRLFDRPEVIPRLMERLEKLKVEAGFILFEQGTPSNNLYFVESGELTAFMVLQDGVITRRLGTMGAGTVVGEMGLYLGTPRTATVVSEKQSILYKLSAEALTAINHEDGELAGALHGFFARLLATRLLHANDQLALLAL